MTSRSAWDVPRIPNAATQNNGNPTPIMGLIARAALPRAGIACYVGAARSPSNAL
jgi:hypothetical protein